MSNPPSPQDIQAAQQALDVLERVQLKVLAELWTTIMLVSGLIAVTIHQVLELFHLRRIAACFIMIYGYAMTWVPSALAPYIGWTTIILSVLSIVRDSMGGRDVVSVNQRVTTGAPASGSTNSAR